MTDVSGSHSLVHGKQISKHDIVGGVDANLLIFQFSDASFELKVDRGES